MGAIGKNMKDGIFVFWGPDSSGIKFRLGMQMGLSQGGYYVVLHWWWSKLEEA